MSEPIEMCKECKDQKCKDGGYSKVKYCKDAFYWSVFGIGAGALFLILIAVYAIIRIIDGNWAQWQLPAIMAIAYFVLVSVAAMFFSLPIIKKEIKGEEKKEEKPKATKKK